jgi:hypothetical protein
MPRSSANCERNKRSEGNGSMLQTVSQAADDVLSAMSKFQSSSDSDLPGPDDCQRGYERCNRVATEEIVRTGLRFPELFACIGPL